MEKMRNHWLFLATVLLASFSLWVCLHIENENTRAGLVLPRNEPGKWRIMPWNEAFWRRGRVSSETGKESSRDLTTAEREQMRKDLQEWRARNNLRGFVGSFGLLQYPAVSLLLLLSGIGVCTPKSLLLRLRYLPPLAIGVFCGFRMLTLAYYPSLGW